MLTNGTDTGMKYAGLLFCGLSMLLNATTASAEEPSHDEMVCALNPKCMAPFVDRRLRGVSATPSVRPALSFDITLIRLCGVDAGFALEARPGGGSADRSNRQGL